MTKVRLSHHFFYLGNANVYFVLSQSMDNPQPKVLQTDSIRGKHMLAQQPKYKTKKLVTDVEEGC